MVFGIPGTDEMFGNMNLSGAFSGIVQFAVLLGLFIIIGILFFVYYYLKKEKEKYKHKVHWFEEINGVVAPLGFSLACELTIPNSNVQVFYIKEKDMYLPRPRIKMGEKAYWYMIKRNGEIVNFKMKNMNEDMTEANLDYDHTDMRYALTNLKDLIKRNYRDKSQPWWREYKDVIGVVVLIFVLTLSNIFTLSKFGGLVDKIGMLIDHADQLIQLAETKAGSGVIIQ